MSVILTFGFATFSPSIKFPISDVSNVDIFKRFVKTKAVTTIFFSPYQAGLCLAYVGTIITLFTPRSHSNGRRALTFITRRVWWLRVLYVPLKYRAVNTLTIATMAS